MNFDDLKAACEDMARLLEDSHPGLLTWHSFLRINMLRILHAAGVKRSASMPEIWKAIEDAGLAEEDSRAAPISVHGHIG